MNKIEEYINQDVDNPKYMFHGSSLLLDKLVPMQSHDDGGNEINVDNAIFLFPSFLKVTPFALVNGLNESVKGLVDSNSYFQISKRDNKYPFATIRNRILNEDAYGYVYVFEKTNRMIKDNGDYQYRCYEELVPIDVVKIYFKDYKKYFEYINDII